MLGGNRWLGHQHALSAMSARRKLKAGIDSKPQAKEQ